jgi:hypothetical protein
MPFTGQLGVADAQPQQFELGGPIPLVAIGSLPVPIFEANFTDDPIARHSDVVRGCGPIAYWRLAELAGTAAQDELGGRTGTYTGGYTLNAAGALGDGDPAVTLNGSTGYVDIPNYSNFLNLPTIAAAYSYSVWAYPTATRVAAASDAAGVFSYELTANVPFALAYGREDTLGSLGNFFWAGFKNGATWVTVVDTTAATLNTWVHYVVTWSAVTKKLTLYRNGVEVGHIVSPATVVATGTSGNKTFIGRRWDTAASGTDEFFPGRIDDVAFFDRTLNPVEAAKLYASGLVRRFKEDGYVDFSSRVRGFTTRRGRQNNVDRVEAGELTVTLDNRDGVLDPDPAAGILPMRQARLKARYGRDIYPLGEGFIERYRYLYGGDGMDSTVELTISDGFKVLSGQAISGFKRPAERAGPRVRAVLQAATIPIDQQDVDDTFIYQANLSAAAPAEGVPVDVIRTGTLTDGSAIVTGLSATADLGVGLSVSGTGIPAGTTIASVDSGTQVTLSNEAALTIVRATGAHPDSVLLSLLETTADLSVGMGVNLGTNYLGEQITQPGTTIAQILSDSSLNLSLRTYDVALLNGQATATFTGATTQALHFQGTTAGHTLPVTGALAHIREIEATELGLFFISADNRYVYQGNSYRDSLSVVAVFDDTALSTVIPYTDLPISYDETNLGNEYVVENPFNQTVYSTVDPVSIRRFFPRTVSVSQLWENDFVLPNERTEPQPRTDSLVMVPAADPARLWPLVLGLEISDKITVARHPFGGADVLAGYDQHIEGIAHSSTPSGWTVTLSTSPVAA